MFQHGAWNRALADIVIFDDVFIDENVYSGLVVGSDHRQNLHELILGSQGVALSQQLQAHIASIEQHNKEIRSRGNAIPAIERGALSIDDFCALQANPNIDQEVQTAEQNLAASRQQDPIRNTPEFQQLAVPDIDLPSMEIILRSGLPDLDAAAAARVQEHLQRIGNDSEQWVAEGMDRQNMLQATGDNTCVFCVQDLSGSPVINQYRVFFSEVYRNHQQSIQDAEAAFSLAHSADGPLSLERAVRELVERRRFWADFGDFPEITIDSATIVADWNAARTQIAQLLEQKKSAPLDPIDVSEEVRSVVATYTARRNEVATLSQQLAATNQTIAAIKQRAATANTTTLSATLATLKATKARHSTATAALCDSYLAEKQAKSTTEQQRDQARQALEQYRTQVFPNYEVAINRYLQRFNAGFQLDSVEAINTRGGPACTYSVVVNNTAVTVGGGNPSLVSPLSETY